MSLKITFWRDGQIIEYIPNEKADIHEILGNVQGALSEYGIVPEDETEEEDDG